jgi:hypothetical protein
MNATISTWHARLSVWSWILTGVFSGLFVALTVGARRHEYALYRIIGIPKAVVRLIAVLEIVLPWMLGTAVSIFATAAGLAFFFQGSILESTEAALVQILLSSSLCLILGVFSILLLTGGSVAQTIRNRG